MEEKSGNDYILNASRDSREVDWPKSKNKDSSKKNIIFLVVSLIAIVVIISLTAK